MGKINVEKNISTAIELLETNEDYFNQLIYLQSEADKKIDYWLHYIEFHDDIKAAAMRNIFNEIRKQRKKRRVYKNDWELIKIFHDNESKMQNASSRKILMNQIMKTDNKQKNAKYSYDAYTEEEANKILGIKKEG